MDNSTHAKERSNVGDMAYRYRTDTQFGNDASAIALADSSPPKVFMSPNSSRDASLDLNILEPDLVPTFVIKIGVEALPFEILYGNHRFRTGGFREAICTTELSASRFRAWTQALVFDKSHEFGGHVWVGEVAGKDGGWKVVKLPNSVPENQPQDDLSGPDSDSQPLKVSRTPTPHLPASSCMQFDDTIGSSTSIFDEYTNSDTSQDVSNVNLSAAEPSRPTSMSTSVELISSMLEIIDVGIFELGPTGRVIYANDTWYRLSGHTKDPKSSSALSFMDCVHPDDVDFVLGRFNALQGKAISFEMRWKAHNSIAESAQWVFVCGCPIRNKSGETLSISLMTIDISGQQKSEEAAATRSKALELARQSERKFARFATLSPIAIYTQEPNKDTKQLTFQYVNDVFFELTGHPRVPFNEISWDRIVVEEDMAKVRNAYSTATGSGNSTEPIQLKLKKTWRDQEGNSSEVWVQGSSCSDLDKNGSTISVMGTLFDISHFKWAESMQRRGIEEALEAKRQADHFIDSTSHELRNPLSAVIQCADSVVSTLQQLLPAHLASSIPELEKVNQDIASCLDYVQIIISCSMHQRRLIDDVLTMSKLDSNLILVTPIPVQPAVVVSDAVRIFDVECTRMKISLNFIKDKTYKRFEWAMLDPSRLVQVLMNMLTNAIKFTKDCPTRQITVTLGSSSVWPPSELDEFTFSAKLASENDIFDKPEWGDGEKGYVWIKVHDTGRGMNKDEQKNLFARFSQASPRTHVKYGGSGLGLYISKSLSGLQGGAIGVNSEPYVGSTFAFFVGSRVAPVPANVSSRNEERFAHTRLVDEELRAARLNILIVEDNLVNQKVLRKELEKAGCRCDVAGNGVEALDWLRKSVYWQGEAENDESAKGTHADTPDAFIEASVAPKHELDLILMDIEMPVMDGLACSRAIRDYENRGLLVAPKLQAQLPPSIIGPLSSPPSPTTPFAESNPLPSFPDFIPSSLQPATPNPGPKLRIPILAVSANARSEQVKHALAAGMDDAIAKPFRIRELRPKMETLVDRLRG